MLVLAEMERYRIGHKGEKLIRRKAEKVAVHGLGFLILQVAFQTVERFRRGGWLPRILPEHEQFGPTR